jgi:hypothetical protein
MTLSDFGESRDKPWGTFLKTLKVVLMSWIARRTDVGARTLIHAVEPDLELEAHGEFLMDSRIVRCVFSLPSEYRREVTDMREQAKPYAWISRGGCRSSSYREGIAYVPGKCSAWNHEDMKVG